MQQVLRYFTQYKINCKNESLSGLTVALALISEAVAFPIIAGVPPSAPTAATCSGAPTRPST